MLEQRYLCDEDQAQRHEYWPVCYRPVARSIYERKREQQDENQRNYAKGDRKACSFEHRNFEDLVDPKEVPIRLRDPL